ncbi:hypothetical protein V8J82_12265 [Gymnodinialimonas sp. 2305UL16-5]|uniref:hypothetical protein n=1 Tax=Gymnodinialimonas mytili TaxID=3126503 RepID=UPI0030A26DA9
MRSRRWHMAVEGDTLVVARRVPVRFDLAVETRFDDPSLRRGRLAHQVRQDMWRRLQRLRGFQPAVAVTREADGLRLVAGGAVDGRIPANARKAVSALLEDAELRERWQRCARRSA